jgi:hypothetical protein
MSAIIPNLHRREDLHIGVLELADTVTMYGFGSMD